MGKIIRPTYPREFSIGLLILIFALSAFLSSQIFVVTWRELQDGSNVYLGMVLVGVAVVVMVLVLWEEFLFPVKVKPSGHGVIFRNHRNKLKTQLLIYCLIPAIFALVYFKYEVNVIRYIIWAGICIVMPIVGKLVSGIKNYNDFLKLTDNSIEYKNNDEVGTFALNDIHSITPVRDEQGVMHKVQVFTAKKSQVTIDLDEMELDPFLDSIDKFMQEHYRSKIANNIPR